MRAVVVALIRRLPGVISMCLVTPVAFVCLASKPASPASADAARTHQTLALWLGTSGSRAVTGLAPGDTIHRVYNVGLTAPVSARTPTKVLMKITATQSSILDTALDDGLELRVDRCTAAWKQRVGRSAFSCAGRTSSVFGWVPIAFLKDKTIVVSSAADGTQHLLLTFRLPASAGNAFEARASVLAFYFSLGS